MFTTSNKVVEGTLYACQLSTRLNRLSSTAAFNGLIFNAAELPLLTHYVFFFVFVCFSHRILCSFTSVFFLLYPWTANYTCISNLTSLFTLFYLSFFLLLLYSSIPCTFSQPFFTSWQFSQKFESKLCSWTTSKFLNWSKVGLD